MCAPRDCSAAYRSRGNETYEERSPDKSFGLLAARVWRACLSPFLDVLETSGARGGSRGPKSTRPALYGRPMRPHKVSSCEAYRARAKGFEKPRHFHTREP